MSGIVFRSYGICASTRPSAPRTAHIELNRAGKALCGYPSVRSVVEPGSPDTEDWKRCRSCWRIAGPEITEIWDRYEVGRKLPDYQEERSP